jgi:hypothetical protein
MARAGLNVRSEVIAVPDLPSGTVTFLFTDIEESTSLVQRLGDRYSAFCSATIAVCSEPPWKKRAASKSTAALTSSSARSQTSKML